MSHSPSPSRGGAPNEGRGDAWAPRAGEILAGRYAVQRLIGKGGMAVVVAARHLQLGEQVAVKILDPKIAADEAGTERFFREARAITSIKSEHVVRVLDMGRSESGLPFFVMELLVGQDLGQLLASGPLPFNYAVDFVLQASEALAEAHAAGIVHRDLKPSNLFLCQRPDGTPLVKVLDFGISKVTQAETSSAKLTETQSIFGSPMYMSPEQIRSAKKVDHRTDVWAIGVVLFELLTGHLPFEAENAASALASITADPPKVLRAFRPDAPPGLEAAILHCLEKDVTRRCQSLSELARLLVPFASQVGQLSASRIERLGSPHAALVPMAAASSGRSLGGGERPTVTAFTNHGSALATPARSPALGIALGVGLAVTILGGVFAVRALGSRGVAASSSAEVASSSSSGSLAKTTDLPRVGLVATDASTPLVVPSPSAVNMAAPGTVVGPVTGSPALSASPTASAKVSPKGGPKYTNVRK